MSTGLIWFRDNLRLADNEPLVKAIEENETVLPVYVLDDAQDQQTKWGFPRSGNIRMQFLFETLSALQKNMRAIGGDLLVVQGNPVQVLPELVKKHSIKSVYAPASFSFNERQEEQDLQHKLDLKLYWSSSLIHPDDLPFDLEKLPDIFTQFRKKIEKYSAVRPTFDPPESISALAVNYDWQAPASTLIPDDRAVLPFTGGENEASKRLQYYFWETENISTYKETRNGLLGADYSSKFSPWLANGSLSPRTIYWELKQFEREITSNQSTYWLFFELLWRDFFRYVSLKFGRRLFLKNGLKDEERRFYFNKNKFEHWRTGNTGEPFVDANMRELLHSGYMSNRGRQNVASYLVHDMGLDWRAGAAWFESQLIDYDPCSNYGNWLYVSGLGNDPRPNRKFNVQRQANMYDPEGKYVETWLNE
jgi:deoxyribodipyrimidine photo-lyase